ncbi:hypothetical protein ACOYR1_09865 [Thalassotalea piscium]
MKNTAIFLLLFSCFSCTSTAENTSDMELNGFKEAIKHVHYLAKVSIVNVDIIHEDEDTDKQTYSAQVLATYRGKAQKNINFEMYVERGEEAMVNKTPIYIALCMDNNGSYYWPGTGSQFSTSEAINTWLTKNKQAVRDMPTTGNWCN